MQIANRIFKNTLALTLANAGQMAGGIILYFYLSRLLQAEGLGIYSTVIALFRTVALGCAIVNPFIPRELPKDLSKTNLYFVHGCVISAACSAILILALFILVPYLGYLPETQQGLYIISIALLPEALDVVVNTIFIAHQKAKFIAAGSAIVILGRILASLLILRLGFGVIGLVVVYAAFSFLSLAINLGFLRRSIFTPYWEFDGAFFWNMLRQLRYFAALTLLSAVFSQSEVIVLSMMGGETQVGYYSAALKLVTIWSMAPKSYVTATFPVLSASFHQSRDQAIELQNRSLKYLFAMAFPLAVGISVAAEPIILLFYGPGFTTSIVALRILAWYLPLTFCNMVLWRILVVRNEQHNVFRVQLTNEIVQVVAAVGLIRWFESSGAAAALICGNLTYLLLSIYFIRRDRTPLPLLQLGWRFFLAAALMGLAAAALLPRLHLAAVVPIAAGIYAGVLFGLRAFTVEDLNLFKRAMGFAR